MAARSSASINIISENEIINGGENVMAWHQRGVIASEINNGESISVASKLACVNMAKMYRKMARKKIIGRSIMASASAAACRVSSHHHRWRSIVSEEIISAAISVASYGMKMKK
jgi:hypothetical protein